MSVTINHSIEAPIDPEMPRETRDALKYYVTLPSEYNASKKYGVVFCIPGFGDLATSEYQQNKLRPYIADKYNLITVGVSYHNDARHKPNSYNINIEGICSFYGIDKSYFQNLSSLDSILNNLVELLVSRKISSLDPRLPILVAAYHNYSSFGFMPAIDHLNVLHDLLRKYNIDRTNIIAFGSSYGGYIASLMSKYAPGTFSLVIDNSGFSSTSLKEVFGAKIGNPGGAWVQEVNGKRYEIILSTSTLWSLDENSPYYFSDAHRQIRNLLNEDHRTSSQTMHCCYHSVNDIIAPIEFKDMQYKISEKYNPVYYKRVTESDIDGKLFKNLFHGMNASLRTMFECAMKIYAEKKLKKDDCTDFDNFVTYGFPCLNKLYNFSYSADKGLDVNIKNVNIDYENPQKQI